MPNRGRHKSHCKRCRRHVSECGPLSARQKCWDCGGSHMLENAAQLRAHRGPFFEHWRRRTLAAFGVQLVVLDEPADEA